MESLYIPSNVFSRVYDAEMIVCDTSEHKTYIVNEVGARILQSIEDKEAQSLDEIIHILKDEYDVEDILLSDVCQSFIKEMLEWGVVRTPNYDFKRKGNSASENVYSEEDSEYHLQKKMSSKHRLYSALIELTYKCNLRCKHCFAISHAQTVPELTTNEVLSLLDDLHMNNVFRLVFTGGEVFLRDDFLEILKYAISKRFLIDIYSNATLLNDNLIREIANCKIRSFHTSIYSHIPEKHDLITGKKASFGKTVTALRSFKQCGLMTNVKTTLMRYNQHDLPMIKKLANEIGASFQPSGT